MVSRVGSAVRDFHVCDEIYARPRDLRIGTFAEYIDIDQDDVAPKAASLTLHEVAAFDQTLEALAYVERGRANGKVVITLD